MTIPRWRTSSYTGENGNCVEVGTTPVARLVRDTKDRTGPALVFAPAAFATFIDTVKDGQLDG